MRLNPRIENWPQAFAVIELIAGAGMLVAAISDWSLSYLGKAGFCVALGLRLWSVGCSRVRQAGPAPHSGHTPSGASPRRS